jgi:hypothetical protein
MEARAYGYYGSTVARRSRPRRFWARFIKGKSELAPTSNVTEVGPEEYAHFEECMNNPQGPTPALRKGADLIRSLRRTNP